MDLLGDSTCSRLQSGKLAVIVGGPPCRTVSARRYQGDNGPPPLRSGMEPYGLSSLTIGQARQVQEDAVLLFRMKLLYLIAQYCRPATLTKVLFGLEQPQDPQEYRSVEDVAQHEYMSIWRTSEWAQFQELGQLQLCRFEQGAFGHCMRLNQPPLRATSTAFKTLMELKPQNTMAEMIHGDIFLYQNEWLRRPSGLNGRLVSRQRWSKQSNAS